MNKLSPKQIGARNAMCPVCKNFTARVESLNGKKHRIICYNPKCKTESKL